MYKYAASDLKSKLSNSAKEQYDVKVDSAIVFILADNSKRVIEPCLLISTDSMTELLIRYNSKEGIYSIGVPSSSINFKNINETNTKSLQNKDVLEYVNDVNKKLKGALITGDTNIEDIPENKILDILNVAQLENGNILDELPLHSENIAKKIRSKKNTVSNSSARQVADKNSVSEENYREFCRKRTLEKNKEMDSFWRNLEYDHKNPIQEELAERFGEGQGAMLMGDTGIGKTFNPEFIAKHNNLSFMTVKLHRASDSVELLGKPSFRANAITGEQEMYYDSGFLTNAFRQATKNAFDNGGGYILVLDELYRAEDMTPFISNLSVNSDNEYVLSIDESNTFAKIETSEGDLWFCISDDISRDKQTYDLKDGQLILNGNTNPLYKFNGSPSQAAERHFRNDLLTIHREDFKELLRINRKAIIETHSEKTRIYTPSRALAIVGTTNIGDNYEVNMGADNALLSRLNPIPVLAPPVSYMVEKTIESVAESKNWKKTEEKMLKSVITNFANALTKVFKNNESIENPQNMNFRIFNDIIRGIDPDKPFGDGKWNVENVLKRSAVKFLSIDSTLTADEIKKDPIIEAVVSGAENAVSLSSNPAFKGVSEKSSEQAAPLKPDDEKETTPGMRM